MPYKYFDSGSSIKPIIRDERLPIQSDNPFAPNYIPEKRNDWYPVEFYKIRPKIFLNFDDRCFLCGELASEIHHIDYNKSNSYEYNMTALCKSCHAKTNFDRSYWQSLIQGMMMEKFGKKIYSKGGK
jgi:hypothetical protein